MGRQSRLRYIRRGLRKAVAMEHVTAQWANDGYREAKGRTAPAPGPWPMDEVIDNWTGKPRLIPRVAEWRKERGY